MIDIKLIRENPDIIKKDLEKRKDSEKLEWIDDLKSKDEDYRKKLKELENLRALRNKVGNEIKDIKDPAEKQKKITEMKEVGNNIKSLEEEVDKLNEKVQWYLDRLPNIMDESVPVGENDEDNVEIRKWGEIKKFSFKPKDHIDLATDLDLVDLERAAKVAGARFFFLKKDLVRLNLALSLFALDFLKEKGFTTILPPFMVKSQSMYSAGFLPLAKADLYSIEGEDLNLVGTAEHPLCNLHSDEILEEKNLPIRYCGFSPCFRTEAGSHGRDTKGFFRNHQFNKVEQFVFCTPEQSKKEHELLIDNAEGIFKKLRIPYRIVDICTGDLGWVASKKYDLEAWLPGQGKYRELVSASNCTDYQARRCNTRCWEHPGAETRFVHTLNATAVAVERTLITIMENYQEETGSIEIPKVLRPYMGGQESISKN
jgi:seryl-tRNA synthetase